MQLPETYGDVIDSTNTTILVNKLSKCNNNAFLGSDETVRFIASILRQKLKYEQVSISKELLMPAYKTIVFFNIPADMRESFAGKILLLSESGLEGLWSNWAEYWNRWNYTWEAARNEIPVKSVSLYDSNVRVVFILLLVLLLCPISVFFVELGRLGCFAKTVIILNG